MAKFGIEFREVGLDWPLKAHTMVGLRRLENLRDLVQRVIDTGIQATSSRPACGAAAAAS
jgi:hypothetical protein